MDPWFYPLCHGLVTLGLNVCVVHMCEGRTECIRRSGCLSLLPATPRGVLCIDVGRVGIIAIKALQLHYAYLGCSVWHGGGGEGEGVVSVGGMVGRKFSFSKVSWGTACLPTIQVSSTEVTSFWVTFYSWTFPAPGFEF